MKREFLTYEQSIDMRAIGFNEPCLAYYDKDGDFLGDISVNEDTDNLYTNADFVMYQDFKVADVSAPTFSQAFRFFREKHNLHSCVAPAYQDEISKVIVYWFWIQGFDSFEDEDINYKTPEEAELNCLLKLIEIVKDEKKNS